MALSQNILSYILNDLLINDKNNHFLKYAPVPAAG